MDKILSNIDEAMAKAQLRAKLQQIEDRFADINEALLGLRELISMYLQETNQQ